MRITTYPSGFDRLFAYRQFVLSSAESGKIFGIAGSAWLTLNPQNFRPVSPAKHLTGLPQWEYEGDIYFQGETLGKIAAPEQAAEEIVTQRVSSTMIDYNRHLNNAFYAMFTEDMLGLKTSSLVRMQEVQINFNASTAFTDAIACGGILNEDGTFYAQGVQQSSGKNAFQAQGRYAKIAL